MKVKDITGHLESIAPLSFQETYDNCGLIVGNHEQEVHGILLAVDVTEDIIDEAMAKKANMIVAHHPVIFSGLKKLTGSNYIEKTIIKAIKNNIAIYAAHTNLDNLKNGVNFKICEKLELKNAQILSPTPNALAKLVTFVPKDHLPEVREAIFSAGAGHIGNYDQCSFGVEGNGSFRALEGANPFVGGKGKIHFEEEIRIETIFPKFLKKKIITALLDSHPYEEVAYDIYSIDNTYDNAGAGMLGVLEQEMDEALFLKKIKTVFHAPVIRHTKLLGKPVKKVAVCGGSGSFLLKEAIAKEADIFISSDFKYHQFFDAESNILIADIGHYESEQFSKELFYELLIKKFPNFAIHLSEINTNPIIYF